MVGLSKMLLHQHHWGAYMMHHQPRFKYPCFLHFPLYTDWWDGVVGDAKGSFIAI
jgi:hypothetical protein